MKDEKIGITCEEALKAFNDLGEALRKEMVQPSVKDKVGPPKKDSTTISVNEVVLAADTMSKLTSERKRTIKEEVKKAIANLFKPFVDEIISFDEAVRKMNEDAEKTEIEDIPDVWKILDISDLSDCPDILVGDYDFRWRNGFPSGGYSIMTVHKKDADLKTILTFLAKENIEYRPTPTIKTHEELAEEYVKDMEISIPLSYSYSDSLKMLTACRISFIAGRKSMESES